MIGKSKSKSKRSMTMMPHRTRAGHWLRRLITLFLVSSGCGPAAGSWSDCFGGLDPVLPYLDPHGQGRDLLGLGFATSRGNYVRVDRFDVTKATDLSGTPVTGVKVQSLALVGSITHDGVSESVSGGQWVGKLLRGKFRCSNPSARAKELDIRLRIAGATQQPTTLSNGGPATPADNLSWLYRAELEINMGTGSQWINACRDSNDVAFPISGYWNEAGDYVRDDSVFSLACTQRDVAKCLRAGYLSDADSFDVSRGLFEACTRMMRADYCGDGQSYTKDGTDITLWDTQGIAGLEHKDPLVFEAAWTSKGMVCFHHLRWPISDSNLPKCLTSSDNRCETAEAAKQAVSEPLVFNESCVTSPCMKTTIGALPATLTSAAGP